MKKIEEFHTPLYEYLKTNRGVGHTTLLKDGALNAQYPYIIMGADMSHANHLAREVANSFAIPRSMQHADAFRGYNCPVLIDNHTFMRTCDGYIGTIRDYREDNQRLRELALKKQRAMERLENLPFWIRAIKPLYKRAIKKANEKGRK